MGRVTPSLLSRERFVELTNRFTTIAPILVCGDLGIDKYTSGIVRRISPEAPVPVLEVNKEWFKLGLAANISHNLQTLTVQNTLCGTIGDDRNGDSFIRLMKECDLKADGLVKISDRPTTFKERVTTNIQQICRVDYEDCRAIEKHTEDKVLSTIEKLLSNHSALIMEDYAKGIMTERVTRESIEIAKNKKKLIAVDPSRNTNPRFFKGCDLLKPNRQEAELMVAALGHREKDIDAMGKILQEELHIKQVVITLGGEGMAIFDGRVDFCTIIPTLATEVFDVSGAGDTSIALLTSALSAGATLTEASWIANCGAGVVVGKHGTATVNMEELLDFHEKVVHSFARRGESVGNSIHR